MIKFGRNLRIMSRIMSRMPRIIPSRLLNTQRPSLHDQNLLYQQLGHDLVKKLSLPKFTVYKDELSLYCTPSTLLSTLEHLKNDKNLKFEQIVDITAVDYPSRVDRFEMVYMLLSIDYSTRIKVKMPCGELTPVPSCVDLFAGANWMEREVWDMFGIYFTGHPDLRRILTDYGFEGHPLRKDFPLTGYVEVRYDDSKKRVVAEPLELAQSFRMFEYQSPWEQNG